MTQNLPDGTTDLVWTKSRRSNADGNCVEVAQLPSGELGVRNSRHPEGSVLVFTRSEMIAFVNGAKDGDFDFVLD